MFNLKNLQGIINFSSQFSLDLQTKLRDNKAHEPRAYELKINLKMKGNSINIFIFPHVGFALRNNRKYNACNPWKNEP